MISSYSCCIVAFNPSIERLNENLKAIVNQVKKIYLINNASDNISDICKLISQFSNVELINLRENYGIAKALNIACEKAEFEGYNWILTLDQDSVCYPGLIEAYIKYECDCSVGQLTCYIQDRNENEKQQYEKKDEIVEWCITSGALVRISAWKKIGGFDDQLFIDGVDRDFGIRLKESGFITLRIGKVGILHEIGKINKIVKINGKFHPIYNHSAMRKYYICRNNIYLARKHKSISLIKELYRTLSRIALVFAYEDCKVDKLHASIKGIIDGFRMNITEV